MAWQPAGPIVFPDAVAEVAAMLRETVQVPVGTEVPNPRPATWVRLLRTGGPSDGLTVDAAQITVEVWAGRYADASALAEQVRGEVRGLKGRSGPGFTVANVEEWGGPARMPDPHSGDARVTWTVTALIRRHL